ncbi:MAG: TIGR03084 family protein [Hyphomicrobiales bacterium]|nr:TIGR03084 family protein [Hyphomicrobiales bacterium]
MEQATDFRDESDALYALVAPLTAADLARATPFKQWTVDHILQHLHFFNVMADLSLRDEDRFGREYGAMKARRLAGETMVAVTEDLLDGLAGPALVQAWHDFSHDLAAHFAAVDPRHRVKWAGPDMSARSSITARLMETWAHGQAVYDLLGVRRENTDRIRNVAVMGVNTYGWTFANRGLEPPGPPPHLRLTAPSGALWEWHAPRHDHLIEGPAEAFCQVVTQTRNVADTPLRVVGEPARQWMALAQCFAGPPHDPPAAGVRG